MFEVATREEAGSGHPLDDVVWNALDGPQSRFALGNDRARRFPATIAPFAALADAGAASFDALHGLAKAQGPVALVTVDEISPPAGLAVVRRAMLLQMLWQGGSVPASDWEHVDLAAPDVPEMMDLVAATQPGPFGIRTIELGDYLGVLRQGRLVAMAGERLKLEGYTEISAVCVDGAFRGQGHAAGLMKRLIVSIRARGETPFLHVITSNHAAIALYRTLGFVGRRELHLAVLEATRE